MVSFFGILLEEGSLFTLINYLYFLTLYLKGVLASRQFSVGTVLLEVGKRTTEEDLYLLIISLLARVVENADLLKINLLTERRRDLTQGKEGIRLDVVEIAKMSKICLLREGKMGGGKRGQRGYKCS